MSGISATIPRSPKLVTPAGSKVLTIRGHSSRRRLDHGFASKARVGGRPDNRRCGPAPATSYSSATRSFRQRQKRSPSANAGSPCARAAAFLNAPHVRVRAYRSEQFQGRRGQVGHRKAQGVYPRALSNQRR